MLHLGAKAKKSIIAFSRNELRVVPITTFGAPTTTSALEVGFMGIPSVSSALPQLNTLGSGTLTSSPPSRLSTPAATGYSMADTFEAAPQRAAGYGGAGDASSGYSGGGYGPPASGVQGAAPAGVAGPVGASGDIGQQLQAIIQQVGQIQQLVEKVGASVAGAGTGAAGPGAAGPGAVGLSNVTGDPGLQQAVQEIARDPEGAKLVQAAQAQGLKLQVGNLPPGVMGQHLNGTITISPRAQQTKQDLIHTMAHELGHAATRRDGNSLNEEQAVDQLAQRIQQRIAPGPTFQLDIGSYRGLPQDNGIRNSLAQIGL